MNPHPAVITEIPATLRKALGSLYARLDAEIAAAAPTCRISGRCCRFKQYDHTLFLTSLEAAVLVRDAPEPCRETEDPARCPWQAESGLCTAREARPLGCRVFFCDPAHRERMPVLTERYLGELKGLMAEYDLDWGYAPLHDHLIALHNRLASDPGTPPTRFEQEAVRESSDPAPGAHR
jgi:Fe-S-cluster containining protein